MKVVVLGSGPAGLLAAHAIEELGHDPVIFSGGGKSEMFGAMYLHREIPGVTRRDPDHEITIIKSGTREGYAKLVYGDPTHMVSWDKFSEGLTYGWDIKQAYDSLWDRFQDRINIRWLWQEDLAILTENYPLIFSTIPANKLCHKHSEHVFESKKIWVQHGMQEGLIPGVNDHDIMYYNGYPPDGSVGDTIGFDWYRFSQLGGYAAWEYSSDPGEARREDDRYTISEGFKPLSTNCNCWPTIDRLGRFGRWDKQQLSHMAYFETLSIVAGRDLLAGKV